MASVPGSSLGIEVVCALPHRAVVKVYHLTPGARVADALRLAAADADFAGVDFGCPVGIHGRVVAADRRLEEGDRIEIYRPLVVDPKTSRRARARQSPARGAPKTAEPSKSGRF